jgi:hypothetical protein
VTSKRFKGFRRDIRPLPDRRCKREREETEKKRKLPEEEEKVPAVEAIGARAGRYLRRWREKGGGG